MAAITQPTKSQVSLALPLILAPSGTVTLM